MNRHLAPEGKEKSLGDMVGELVIAHSTIVQDPARFITTSVVLPGASLLMSAEGRRVACSLGRREVAP